MKNNKGFSLVELIVVIAIMAILAAVAIPTFSSFIAKANQASDDDFMSNLEYAINLANTTNHEFELTEIAVTVNDKGEITEVKYKADGITETGYVTVAKDATTEPTSSIAGVIDWDYTFKAAKNETVTVDLSAATTEAATTEAVSETNP